MRWWRRWRRRRRAPIVVVAVIPELVRDVDPDVLQRLLEFEAQNVLAGR